MLYLLDANTLINAKRDFYQFKRVPPFWNWLVYQGNLGNIKIPQEIYEEFKDTKDSTGKKDELAVWSDKTEVKDALLFTEEFNQDYLNQVIYEGYLENPTEDDIIKMGKDPFLISYGLEDRGNRCIVSAEVSKPKKKGANRKVPDVCKLLGVPCCNVVQMINTLDFRIDWDTNLG